MIGDPALKLGERLTGPRQFDDGINDRMPLGFVAIRRPARHCVADNVAHMLGTYFEVSTNGGRQVIQLFTHDLTALVAAHTAHRLHALTVAQVGQRAEYKARSRALPKVRASAHGKCYAQFLEGALKSKANGPTAVEHGDALGRGTLAHQLGDGACNLAGLYNRRRVTTDHDLAWFRHNRSVILDHPSEVARDQSLCRVHDLGRQAIIVIEQ